MALAIRVARCGSSSLADISRMTVSTGITAVTDSTSSSGETLRPSWEITGRSTSGEIATSA